MALTNREGVYFCFTPAGRAIFLDLERDRYIAATRETTEALARLIDRDALPPAARSKLDKLVSSGLLAVSENPGARPFVTCTAPPCGEVGNLPRTSLILVSTALLHQLRAALELRIRGLAKTIGDRSERSGPVAHSSRACFRDIAAAFAASHFFVSAHGRCLMKSIALRNMLMRAGHAAQLVLGVRDQPFNAHAWVQMDDQVVGDTLERVLLYRPILIV